MFGSSVTVGVYTGSSVTSMTARDELGGQRVVAQATAAKHVGGAGGDRQDIHVSFQWSVCQFKEKAGTLVELETGHWPLIYYASLWIARRAYR